MAGDVGFRIDASDFAKLSKAFAQLPPRMRSQVFGRAIGRSRSVAERTYAQLSSRRMDIAQKHIKSRMRSFVTQEEMTIAIRSTQIPLDELGAKQTSRGVTVALRGSYRSAFVAKAGKAKGRVLKRHGKARLPTKMLFGPNPAGEATRNPDIYEQMLGEIANGVFFSEIARGISYMLGKV